MTEVLKGIDDPKLRQRETQAPPYRGRGTSQGLSQVAGAPQIGLAHPPQPPLIQPSVSQHDNTLEVVARTAFEAYKVSQPEERGVLLDRYRLTDVAFKVVGIGSVGTFCALGLFADRDGATLLLQLKEAQQSVLAPHTAPSVYVNQGQRVVTGQRIMQGEHDIFLGWTSEHGSDQYCYVRDLKNSRLAAIGDEIADCGAALLRHPVRHGAGARACTHPEMRHGSPATWDRAARSMRPWLSSP